MKPFVTWITGLPGSGKTTLAQHAYRWMEGNEVKAVHIDADLWWTVVHDHIESDHNTSARWHNIQQLVKFTRSLLALGYCVITDTVAPLYELREYARKEIEQDANFYEVLLRCPIHTCEARKPEGYVKARSGEFKSYPGVHVLYEESPQYDLSVSTDEVGECETLFTLRELLRSREGISE